MCGLLLEGPSSLPECHCPWAAPDPSLVLVEPIPVSANRSPDLVTASRGDEAARAGWGRAPQVPSSHTSKRRAQSRALCPGFLLSTCVPALLMHGPQETAQQVVLTWGEEESDTGWRGSCPSQWLPFLLSTLPLGAPSPQPHGVCHLLSGPSWAPAPASPFRRPFRSPPFRLGGVSYRPA